MERLERDLRADIQRIYEREVTEMREHYRKNINVLRSDDYRREAIEQGVAEESIDQQTRVWEEGLEFDLELIDRKRIERIREMLRYIHRTHLRK